MLETKFDTNNIDRMWAELDEKRRLQALKGGYRKLAKDSEKKARANIAASGLHSQANDAGLQGGLRSLVFRQKVGFRLTIGPRKANKNGKGERGMHVNRQGLTKPVLSWAEGGTKQRKTKNGGGRAAYRKRAAHSTGAMRAYHFMERTSAQLEGTLTDRMREMVTQNVERIAKKYGAYC